MAYLIRKPSDRFHHTREDGITSRCGFRKAGKDGWEVVADSLISIRRERGGDPIHCGECGHCYNQRLRDREKHNDKTDVS